MEGGPAAKQLLGEDRVRVWPNIRVRPPCLEKVSFHFSLYTLFLMFLSSKP